MTSLTPAQINRLSRFFRDHNALSLKVGKKLEQWLLEHFDNNRDFYFDHKIFTFDSSQKNRFQTELTKLMPRINWLEGLSEQQNRISITEHLNRDKLASIGPEQSYVLIKAQAGNDSTLPLDHNLPIGASLRLPINELNLANISNIVIVENLDCFDHWHLAQAPEQLASVNTIAVYRGHEKSLTQGVKQLINLARQQTRKITLAMFPDFDPKGLENCCTAGVDAILLPDIKQYREKLIQGSDSANFNKQTQAQVFLSRRKADSELFYFCLNEHLATTQQYMLQHQLPLKLYPSFTPK